jgi:outer membrane immunogenic protein
VGTTWGALDFTDKFGNTDTDPLAFSEGVLAIGYDFRLAPALVAGVFADYAFGGSPEGTVGDRWAVGARLGVLATQSALLYASAGYTEGDSQFDFPHRLRGYFVGAGAEYLVTANLSLKVDYRFSDHKDWDVDFGFGNTFTLDADIHSFRLGVNWRFGPFK